MLPHLQWLSLHDPSDKIQHGWHDFKDFQELSSAFFQGNHFPLHPQDSHTQQSLVALMPCSLSRHQPFAPPAWRGLPALFALSILSLLPPRKPFPTLKRYPFCVFSQHSSLIGLTSFIFYQKTVSLVRVRTLSSLWRSEWNGTKTPEHICRSITYLSDTFRCF